MPSLAVRLSSELFGGLKFRESKRYDEVPTMELESNILGMAVILSAATDENWYQLELRGLNAESPMLSESRKSMTDSLNRMIIDHLRSIGFVSELE